MYFCMLSKHYIHFYSKFMALPKFYIEPRPSANGKQPINMFYSFSGQRLQYYTGIRIDPKFYKSVDGKGNAIDKTDVGKLISDSAPYANVIKTNLKQLAMDVQMIENTAKANRIPVTKEYLRTELDKIHKHKSEEQHSVEKKETDFLVYYEKLIADSKAGIRVIQKGRKAGQKFTYNAIKNHSSTLSAIKRYMTTKRMTKINFSDINKDFYVSFKNFCYGPNEEKEISTFAGFIKDIKTVMNEAGEAGLQMENGHKASLFIMPSYEADTKALTLEEVDMIHDLDLSDKPRLDKIRDLFLIGCYSALRFSNFSQLKIENISDGFIRLKQVKTGDLVTIPIMARLQRVLDKYDGSLPSSVSNQEFNRVIKEVVKAAGIDYLVEVKSYNGGQLKITQQPMYQLVSSHTARRSYATIMFKKGIPAMLIMSATGHRDETSFLKYIRATNEDKAVLMAEALKKLGL
jgi:hypothetical protein